MASQVTPGRPPRADAARNRARIVSAAMAAFSEHGIDVLIDSIAERAGVGVGTVYRHFPTKQALVNAILADLIAAATEAAASAAAEEQQPWDALERFMRFITTAMIRDRVLSHYIGGRITGSPSLQAQRYELFEIFATLVSRARQAGQLRPDVEPNDIRQVAICVARAITGPGPDPGWVLDRYLPIVLDGLRAPGLTTLSGIPAATADLEPAPEPDPAFQRGRRR